MWIQLNQDGCVVSVACNLQMLFDVPNSAKSITSIASSSLICSCAVEFET